MATAPKEDCRDIAVICSICLEVYTEPKMLPCFHTFCKVCLEQYAGRTTKNRQFPCPQCRCGITVPPNGIQGFQENFYITNLRSQPLTEEDPKPAKVQQKKKLKVCVKCENNEAKYECKTCNKCLCNSCTKVHKKEKSKKHHHVSLITDDSTTVAGHDFCPKHKSRGEILVYFCQRCQTPICLSCKVTAHEGHPTEDLEDRHQAAKKSLQELNFEVLKCIKDLEELKGSAMKIEVNCQRSMEVLREGVANDKTKLINAVNGRAELLERILQRHAKEAQNSLNRQTQKVERHLLNLEKIRDEAENTLAKGSFSEIQSATGNIQAGVVAIKKDLPKKLECSLNVSYSKPMAGSVGVESLFGRVNSTDAKEKPLAPCGTKTLLTFTVPRATANLRMMATSKDGIYVCYNPFTPALQFVSHTGAFKDEWNFHSQISSVAVGKNGNVFVAFATKKCVEIFKPDSVTSQVLSNDLPLKPLAVAALKEGVVVLGSSGTIKHGLLFVDNIEMTWMFRDYDGAVLMKPSAVAVWIKESHAMIIVADPKAHRVVFFGKKSKEYALSYLYCGEGLHKDPEKFCPTGVCVDKLGNIFVADTTSRSVIQLSRRGRLMDDMSITFEDDFVPHCITSSYACNLLVAGSDGKVKVIKRGCT